MVSKTVDAEAVVKRARELAKEHGWCEVVEDALVELGLVENAVQDVELVVTFSLSGIRIGDMTNPEQWVKDNFVVWSSIENEHTGEYIFDDRVDAKQYSVSVKPVDESGVGGPNWYYATNEGRVMHHFPSSETWSQSSCGGIYAMSKTKTSPRGEDRRCAKCVQRTSR